jgi:DNA adenine methylase
MIVVTGRLPHPIPYQGSKRQLAPRILGLVATRRFATLYEPFAGSAAITLAARSAGLAERFVLGDSLAPLVHVWDAVIERPSWLADEYERLWLEQEHVGPDHFNQVRASYNSAEDPAELLYLLARCVKNAPRFNGKGGFSQSADHRRKGMRPEKMARQIHGANALLAGVTETFVGDAVELAMRAGPEDIVYMDPPWQGTTEGADKRYHQGFDRARLEALLADLNRAGAHWVLSYDGQSGSKVYGPPLDAALYGEHHLLDAGRSSQATLVGRDDRTLESVYVSPSLVGAASSLTLFDAAGQLSLSRA